MAINTAPKYAGEPTTQSVASGLATLGRYGDNYMVHAAEGETMIPKEVFDENPTLKQDLFRQMAMMGIKDPNRYVVGHELNSINPDTGQPEFFFKKIFKAFKKVVKKIAPIAAPIIGNMIAPGIGGLIASGLVTKMQGGSWGDVAKSVALSYGASALTSGIGGALQGTSFGNTIGMGPVNPTQGGFGGFTSGLARGFSAPFQAGRGLIQGGTASPLAQGILGPRGAGIAYQSLAGTPFAQNRGTMSTLFPGYQTGSQLSAAGIDPQTGGLSEAGRANVQIEQIKPTYDDAFKQAQKSDLDPSLYDSYAREVSGGGVSSLDQALSNAGLKSSTTASNSGSGKFLGLDFPGSELAAKVAGPATVSGLLAGAAYFLTPEEETTAQRVAALNANNPRRVAYDKWQGIADKNSEAAMALKNEWYGPSSYTAEQLSRIYGAQPISGITAATERMGNAMGGEIIGPGTGTSDSIPARLSDGEFVMTAQAVRNAGNGNRDVGAARMYDMMNRFEQGTA